MILDDTFNQESHSQTEWESDPSLTPWESQIPDSFIKKKEMLTLITFQNNRFPRKITELIQTPK